MTLRFEAVAALVLLAGCHARGKAPAPIGPPEVLKIAATGDVWGQIEPCG